MPMRPVMQCAARIVLVMDPLVMVLVRLTLVMGFQKFGRYCDGLGVRILVHSIHRNQRDNAPDLRDQEKGSIATAQSVETAPALPRRSARVRRVRDEMVLCSELTVWSIYPPDVASKFRVNAHPFATRNGASVQNPDVRGIAE